MGKANVRKLRKKIVPFTTAVSLVVSTSLLVQNQPSRQEVFAKTAVVDTNAASATATTTDISYSGDGYELITGPEAFDRSVGQLALIKGENITGLEGSVRGFDEDGVPVAVFVPDRSSDLPTPGPDEVYAIANKRFWGSYSQDQVWNGEIADLAIFAKNSGVPIRSADMSSQALSDITPQKFSFDITAIKSISQDEAYARSLEALVIHYDENAITDAHLVANTIANDPRTTRPVEIYSGGPEGSLSLILDYEEYGPFNQRAL